LVQSHGQQASLRTRIGKVNAVTDFETSQSKWDFESELVVSLNARVEVLSPSP
jgi:hypothetical protein